jgi:acyl dehydratase
MALSKRDVNVGDSREVVLTEDLTRTQIVQYAGASGDYNPLHTDATYAQEVAGYPGVFAHGMLTMGMTGRAVTDWVGDGRLTAYGVRFTSQVWPGERLVTRLTVKQLRSEGGDDLVDLDVVTLNSEGVPVISGYATARLGA